MKEKFNELEKFYAKGNILAMLSLSIILYTVRDIITFSRYDILSMILYEVIYAFLFGGMFYAIKKIHFKFTLNPIKLYLMLMVNIALLIFFTCLYPFLFLITILRYGIEILKTRKAAT